MRATGYLSVAWAAALLATTGCTQVMRTEQADRGEQVDVDVFLHEHLQQVPMVTTAEAYRAMVILAEGDDAFDSFAARQEWLEAEGIARSAWGLQRDACIDRGAVAYMACRIARIDGGVNQNVLGAAGIGDRRYANRELVYRGLLADGAPYQFMTGSELVSLISLADRRMSEEGLYEGPEPVRIVDELAAVQQELHPGSVVITEPSYRLAMQDAATQPAEAVVPATRPAGEPMQARVLRATEGRVSYALPGPDGEPGAWQPAKAGDLLPAGTRIRTRTRAQLLLQFGDDTVVVIERATLASIDEFNRTDETKEIQIGLGHGAVRGGVAETTLRSDMTIATPTAVLSKRGTMDFRIWYEPSRRRFRISLADEGLVEALDLLTNEARLVRPGEYVTQMMLRWIDRAVFDRYVPVIDIFGQTEAEEWFNAFRGSDGLLVVEPGAGWETYAVVTRDANEQAALARLAAQPFYVRFRPGFELPDTTLDRPEGNFGTGR